jgi:N-methylhydantoinase A
MNTGWQVGIDIGGTFTDVVASHPDNGAVLQAKVRSRPDDPIVSLLAALDAVSIRWEDVDDLMHGTTLVTNAIVEDKLTAAALVSTEGFTDTLAIGRQNRRYLYRLDLPPKPEPQIPEALRIGVSERIDVHGEVLEELSDETIEEAARQVAASGVKAVAVSLLHGYANGRHEERLGARLREVVPYVALSHRVSPEAREFERTSTTALSAGVMPLTAGYLDRLEQQRPKQSRLHLFHSAGGMAAPDALRDHPLGLAFSGPAAGVSAAGWVAEELGLKNVISFDMGGTTTDVCLIVDGCAEIRSDRNLGGRPLRMPIVAVESIGAGGGSIARLDTGALRVGPESAGADPGPACYGFGGKLPTVSDANLVLGYLNAKRCVGGVVLDNDAALAALNPLARAVGVETPALALGIVRVATASMARALRRVTVERGVDGRDCVLLAFGGAGPMHAVELARSFGIRQVVVPCFSSVFSALGCVTAAMSYTRQRTVRMSSGDWDRSRLDAIRTELMAHLAPPLEAAGHAAPEVAEVAAVRYSGQSYAVEVMQPALDSPERLGEQFRARHETLYGFATDEPWELVSLRLTLSAQKGVRPNATGSNISDDCAPTSSDDCWFGDGAPLPTPRYAREGLKKGGRLKGPAVVEDAWSTVVLPPGSTLGVDESGHLHIDVGDAP